MDAVCVPVIVLDAVSVERLNLPRIPRDHQLYQHLCHWQSNLLAPKDDVQKSQQAFWGCFIRMQATYAPLALV